MRGRNGRVQCDADLASAAGHSGRYVVGEVGTAFIPQLENSAHEGPRSVKYVWTASDMHGRNNDRSDGTGRRFDAIEHRFDRSRRSTVCDVKSNMAISFFAIIRSASSSIARFPLVVANIDIQ